MSTLEVEVRRLCCGLPVSDPELLATCFRCGLALGDASNALCGLDRGENDCPTREDRTAPLLERFLRDELARLEVVD